MYNYYYYYFISAHKSDLSNPWSQTQASLSIPSHTNTNTNTNTNKRREREEKNNRRENLPRSDLRGREKNKTRAKNKQTNIFRLLIGWDLLKLFRRGTDGVYLFRAPMQAMASHASGSRITVLLIVVIYTGHFRNFLILTVNRLAGTKI